MAKLITLIKKFLSQISKIISVINFATRLIIF